VKSPAKRSPASGVCADAPAPSDPKPVAPPLSVIATRSLCESEPRRPSKGSDKDDVVAKVPARAGVKQLLLQTAAAAEAKSHALLFRFFYRSK
jgi:hypothetical protein|tara:strand:- start:18 stop:296 length:279 start_codon:yes stop_codon:yes gene_type:complete